MANFSVKAETNIVNGVVEDRGCTDILCLLIFMAFIGTMGVCTYYGYKNGNIDKYFAPLDGRDKFCGIDDGEDKYKDYPYLYFTKIEDNPNSYAQIFQYAVCVKKCPVKQSRLIECHPESMDQCN